MLNHREKYLLKFLLGAEWIDLHLANALLAPKADLGRGVARVFGAAKSDRNSYTYVMLRRLVSEGILRRHPDIKAYSFGRKAELLFEGKHLSIVRSFARSRKRAPYVLHDLIATQLMVAIDLAQQVTGRWRYRILSGAKEPTLVFPASMRHGNLRLDRLIELSDLQFEKCYWFFLEADRGTCAIDSTLPNKRSIISKAERFYEYAQAGLFRKHWGIPGAHLIFVVTGARQSRLVAIRGAIKDSRRIHKQSDLYRYVALRDSFLKKPVALMDLLVFGRGVQ